MTKTIFRYFFDFVEGQEQWLNEMAGKGYRLKNCGVCWYTFEQCQPGDFSYSVAFVADKSYREAKTYRQFLEQSGFRVLTKNINLNLSFGKLRWRPFAKGWGQLATLPGGYNKELFLVEKKHDGTPFVLHSDLAGQLLTVRAIRNASLWATLCLLGLFAMTFLPVLRAGVASSPWTFAGRLIAGGLGVIFALFAVRYTRLITELEEESKTLE